MLLRSLGFCSTLAFASAPAEHAPLCSPPQMRLEPLVVKDDGRDRDIPD
jgi:hypothetical protein